MRQWSTILKVSVLLIIAGSAPVPAQKARKHLSRARLHYFNGELRRALHEYQRAHALDPDNPKVMRELGICMAQVWGYQQSALTILRQVRKFYPRDPLVLYHLARAYQFSDSCEQAINLYRKAIAVSKQKKTYLQIKELANRGAQECQLRLSSPLAPDISVVKLPPGINTPTSDEYGVFLNMDETIMFFTRGKGTGISIPGVIPQQDANIYLSLFEEKGWTQAHPADSAALLLTSARIFQGQLASTTGILTSPLNTSHFWERTAWLSASGMALYISRGEPFSAWGDILLTTLEPNGWSIPTRLPPQINSPSWEGELALTPDGKIIVFASNRNGGKGGTDLWMSQLIEGQWTSPQNLEQLNTYGNERYPFITADGEWLVFSSDGHLGFGGYDLFAVRIGSGFSLGKVEHIPYPVNTAYDELNIWISPDLFHGYFSSNRHDSTLEIFMAHFESGFMNQGSKLVLKGRVLIDKIPVRASILVYEVRKLGTRQTILRYVGEFASDPSGNYLLVLTPGKRYRLVISTSESLLFSEIIKAEAPAERLHIVERDFDISTDIALDSVVLTTARLPQIPDTDIASYLDPYEAQWLANYLWKNLFLTAHISVHLPHNATTELGNNFCGAIEKYLKVVEVYPQRISCSVQRTTGDSLHVGVKFAGLPIKVALDTTVKPPARYLRDTAEERHMTEVKERFANVSIQWLTYKIAVENLTAGEAQLTEAQLRTLKFLQKFSIEEEIAPDGSSSVLIGDFYTFAEAESILQTLALIGIQDAHIVPYIKDKRSSWRETISLLREFRTR